MKNKRDYYEILGIQRDVHDEEIKKSYRQLALRYHPDRNPGRREAEERFMEATEAYEVLIDPEKRRIYDRYGHVGLEGSAFQGFRQDFAFSSFHDLFEDFFGWGDRPRSSRRAVAGADLRYDLTIGFYEAAFGAEKEIHVSRMEECAGCSGSGVERGFQKDPCRSCGGTGRITRSQGFIRVATTCPHCGGSGQVNPHPCEECRGSGRVQAPEKIRLKIPQGVGSGMELRVTGKGERGLHGGPPGDLFVRIRVEDHGFFQRDGEDIVCRLPVSFVDAALGATVEVRTLEGVEKIRIRKGTQPGERLRLQGKGIPRLRGRGRGDQIVIVDVRIPTRLSRKQRKLLRDFALLGARSGSGKSKSRTYHREEKHVEQPPASH